MVRQRTWLRRRCRILGNRRTPPRYRLRTLPRRTLPQSPGNAPRSRRRRRRDPRSCIPRLRHHHSLRHNPQRSPGTRNGKSPLCRRRTHRSYLGSSTHETIQKHQRHGTQISQEKIQEQRLRRRLLPRSNRTRRRTTRLGTAETAHHDTAGNGRLRG